MNWSRTVRPRRHARLVAAPVLAGALVLAASPPAHAIPVGDCTPSQSFWVGLGAGKDDLRGDSEVTVTFVTRFGRFVDLQPIKDRGGVPSYEERWFGLGYASPTIPVDACQVTGVIFRMVSHNNGFETSDNWDMDRFEITGLDGTVFWGFPLGRPNLSMSARSFPRSNFHRFTGEEPDWQFYG